ncbi:reverse transcriptase domain-containing protein [Tanacetum coccineum]|uniref:Reverse transcriptase domain-containing protein n=1 Tax=Tanacetum coccineum TaxID=301880 RepID=A0ABQ5J0T7_9ASTR
MQNKMADLKKILLQRPQGALLSNTEPNLREQVNSIMTRSGLTTVEPSIPPSVPPTPRVEMEKEPETLMDEVHITSPTSTAHVPPPEVQPVSPPKPKEDPKPNPHQPKISYPSRLNKIKLLDKTNVQISRFYKILKQIHFDISLMGALTQIPKFTKVLKDILKDKEKLEELANTPINVECSAILLNKVPEKPEDPGKFLIPCILQDLEVYNSLSRYREQSINLIPLSIYEKLRVGPLKPTRMTLELANRSVTFPMGIAKDVIIKVENFNFLANFVIVDFEADPRVSIILGRPFLRTFADELALLDPFPSGNEDDSFDPEADLREIKYLLNRDSSTVSSSMTDIDIIDPILESLEDSKPMKTPMSSDTKLTKDKNAPKTSHLEAVKHIFRYIKGTTHLGLWYPKGTGIKTVVYFDSDHAGDYVDTKSTSGICTFIGCCLTSWFSKKQTALAISTTESEYVSAGKACQQALWMKQALIDYDI